MTRNLEVLGLALVAVLAMSAVAASMASAQKLTTDGASVTLDGVEDGKNILVFPGLAGGFECPGSTIKGHKLATTPHEAVPASATTVTVNAIINNLTCHNGASKATVTMNGCNFVSHANWDFQDPLSRITKIPHLRSRNFPTPCDPLP